MKLDLKRFAKIFEEVKVSTDVMLVVEIEGVKASIYPSGRVLLHDCDEDKGQELAAHIYEMITNKSKRTG